MKTLIIVRNKRQIYNLQITTLRRTMNYDVKSKNVHLRYHYNLN